MIHRIASVMAALLLAGCVQAGMAAKPIEQRGRSAVVSRGEEGAIRDKVKQCWNVGSASATRPIVRIRVDRINPDGTIPPGAVSILDDGGDRDWANAARRAVLNPVCQPWPMPPGGWPNDAFILVFDPRDMF